MANYGNWPAGQGCERKATLAKRIARPLSAALLMLGSAATASALTVPVTTLGCSMVSGAPLLTDTPTGFTVTGNLQLNVPVGSSDCSIAWLAQRPIIEVAGTPASVSTDLQFAIGLPPGFSSDVLLLVSTSHSVEGVSEGPSSFAALLFIQSLTDTNNTLTGQTTSQPFLDQGGPDTLAQQFSLDVFNPPAGTMEIQFSVTSENNGVPEPSTGSYLAGGLALVVFGLAARRRIGRPATKSV